MSGTSRSEAEEREKSAPTLMWIAGSRLSMAMVLAFFFMLAVCLIEFREEAYFHNKYIKLETSRIAASATFNNGQLEVRRNSSLSHFYGPNAADYSFRILEASGKVLLVVNAPLMRSAVPDLTNPDFMIHHWQTNFAPDKYFHIAGAAVKSIAGKDLVIEVATRGDPDGQRFYALLDYFFEDISREFLPTALLMSIFMLASLRDAYRPMLALAKRADNVKPRHDIPQFDTKGLPAEAASFAKAINRLLARNRTLTRAHKKLMAGAAHELRTPLHIMMLELNNLPPDVAGRLQSDIVEMGNRVDQLLALARMDIMTEVIKCEDISMGKLIEQEIEHLRPLFRKKRNEIVTSCHDPCITRGDTQMVRQTIRNLLENASKHTPDGTRIMISCGPNGQLLVEDNGGRFNCEDMTRLFDPFYRNGTKCDGVGLGLSIVQQAVALHGGTVRVQRNELGGARFTLSFGDQAPVSTATNSGRKAGQGSARHESEQVTGPATTTTVL